MTKRTKAAKSATADCAALERHLKQQVEKQQSLERALELAHERWGNEKGVWIAENNELRANIARTADDLDSLAAAFAGGTAVERLTRRLLLRVTAALRGRFIVPRVDGKSVQGVS